MRLCIMTPTYFFFMSHKHFLHNHLKINLNECKKGIQNMLVNSMFNNLFVLCFIVVLTSGTEHMTESVYGQTDKLTDRQIDRNSFWKISAIPPYLSCFYSFHSTYRLSVWLLLSNVRTWQITSGLVLLSNCNNLSRNYVLWKAHHENLDYNHPNEVQQQRKI